MCAHCVNGVIRIKPQGSSKTRCVSTVSTPIRPWVVCLLGLFLFGLSSTTLHAQNSSPVNLRVQHIGTSATLCCTNFAQTEQAGFANRANVAFVTDTPTATITPTPTETATLTPSPSSTGTITNTATSTFTTTSTATATQGNQPVSPLATPTFTPQPTFTQAPTLTPPPTASGTATFTPLPTETFTPAPTPTPMGTHVVAPAIVEFVAEPGSVAAGQSTNLRWNLARTNSATISHDGGQEPIDPTTGIIAVAPLTTTRYTLMASGAGGQVSRSITITVQSAPTAAPPMESTLLSETGAITEGSSLVEPVVEIATNTPEAVAPTPTENATAPPIALNLTPNATITPETDEEITFDRSGRMRTVLLYGLFALGVLAPIALIVAAIIFRSVWRRR